LRRVATRGRGSAAAGLAAVIALTVAGCTSKSSAEGLDLRTPATSKPAPTATPAPTPRTETERILGQYGTFYTTLERGWRVGRHQRVALFETVAVEPELSRVVGAMLASDSLGETGYGKIIPRPRITKISGQTAWITDCQDGSRAGRVKIASGRKTTRGTSRDLAIVSMQRGSDGVWRLSTVTYRPAGSC
jgi:hypothetical protein